jgi:hypothetical protein
MSEFSRDSCKFMSLHFTSFETCRAVAMGGGGGGGGGVTSLKTFFRQNNRFIGKSVKIFEWLVLKSNSFCQNFDKFMKI